MRYVPRSSKAPLSLGKKDNFGKSELDYALEYYEPANGTKPKKAYAFKAYKGEDVKREFERLFHGKCAYCESYYASTAPVDVEHYRPKGGVEGEAHSGYWWLAAEWKNLLPSCIDCNRRRKQRTPKASATLVALQDEGNVTMASLIMATGKKDSFPIAGPRAADRHARLDIEMPLLINPCDEDPAKELVFNLDPDRTVGVIFPKPGVNPPAFPQAGAGVGAAAIVSDAQRLGMSLRGAVSIQVYGLNRLALVQQRTRILRQLEFLGSLIVDLATLRERVDNALKQSKDPLLKEVSAKLAELEQRIYAEIGGMKHDSAPHCAMVKAWLETFTRRIAAA